MKRLSRPFHEAKMGYCLQEVLFLHIPLSPHRHVMVSPFLIRDFPCVILFHSLSSAFLINIQEGMDRLPNALCLINQGSIKIKADQPVFHARKKKAALLRLSLKLSKSFNIP